MALATTMTRFAEAVTGAVHQFAASEGWTREDYILTAIFDREAECVWMNVGSTRPLDRVHWSSGIFDRLVPIFGSRSQAGYHTNLVVRQVDRLDDIFKHYRLEAHEVELTDFAR